MEDLNKYVEKYVADWKDIGKELELPPDILETIEKDYPDKIVVCFKEVLAIWLESNPNATWKILEDALTYVRRQQLGLDVHRKDRISTVHFAIISYKWDRSFKFAI